MGKSDEKKKKKLTFEKIEDGMIFRFGDNIAVGFPIEVETRTSVGGRPSVSGGRAKGENYKKIKYNWEIISGSPLPETEMDKLEDEITAVSGTFVASLGNASSIGVMQKCRKCGTPLFLVGEEFQCQKCGEPTV